MTRSPSVSGVADQNELVPCVGSLGSNSTWRCQSSLPLARSRHHNARLCPGLSSDCEMNTRWPQITGDEFPSPGNATFQRTFSWSLQVSGKFFSAVCPFPCGPRQPGQSPASANVVLTNKIATERNAMAVSFQTKNRQLGEITAARTAIQGTIQVHRTRATGKYVNNRYFRVGDRRRPQLPR